MRSAVLFLPSFITVLMNLVTSVLLYSGSAASSRFGISLRRGIFFSFYQSADGCQPAAGRRFLRRLPAAHCLLLFRPLGSVLRASLLPSLNTDRVERPANDVIPDSRQILDAAASNQHERVL